MNVQCCSLKVEGSIGLINLNENGAWKHLFYCKLSMI